MLTVRVEAVDTKLDGCADATCGIQLAIPSLPLYHRRNVVEKPAREAVCGRRQTPQTPGG